MTVKKEHAADHEPNESFDAPWLVWSGRYPEYTMHSTRNGVNMVRALSIIAVLFVIAYNALDLIESTIVLNP